MEIFSGKSKVQSAQPGATGTGFTLIRKNRLGCTDMLETKALACISYLVCLGSKFKVEALKNVVVVVDEKIGRRNFGKRLVDERRHVEHQFRRIFDWPTFQKVGICRSNYLYGRCKFSRSQLMKVSTDRLMN